MVFGRLRLANGRIFRPSVIKPDPAIALERKAGIIWVHHCETDGKLWHELWSYDLRRGLRELWLLWKPFFGWMLGLCARVVQQYQEIFRSEYALVLTSMVSFEFFSQVRGDLQGMTTPLIERVALLAVAVWSVTWLGGRIRNYALARNL